MASSFENMAELLEPILEKVAADAGAMLGGDFEVHLLPVPGMDRRAVWIQPPGPASVRPIDTAFDEALVRLEVCVTIPYESQRDDQMAAWKLCDLLQANFPDQMVHFAGLRGTRRRSIQPLSEQWGADAASAVQLTVRCLIEVPVRTLADL